MKPWIKVKPHYDEAQWPPLSAKVSFVRIDPADLYYCVRLWYSDFRRPLCAQLFLSLCFSKVMIFDFHFWTVNDDPCGQAESNCSLCFKKQTIWLKNGYFEAFKNHHFHSKKRSFLFICTQLFLLLCSVNKLVALLLLNSLLTSTNVMLLS